MITYALKILMWGSIATMAYLFFSCEEFCEEPNRTAVVVNFYTTENTALNAKDLTIRGIENDSTLQSGQYLSNKDFLQVKLPLNPSADFMSYAIIKNDTLPVDTIIIKYTRHHGFISPQCGCVTFAEILNESEITDNTILRMEITNPNVNTVSYRQGVINEENIRIDY